MIPGFAHAVLAAMILGPPGSLGLTLWDHYAPWDMTPPRHLEANVDRIVIDKRRRTMRVYRDGEIRKVYRPIALGFAPEGDKFQEGDGRTPEGTFRIDRRNDRSAYHLSLGIDYPQPHHRSRARGAGVSPGGDIFIHGQPNQRKGRPDLPGDWTAGCVAITDAEIEELFRYTPMGTVVEILP
ncbi:L,D-transpeptidase family protein [Tropicimonas isoalkanivorans]|uniref:L,D-transpeptidase catalytic domain n=1 Tax=Tropicimonas isoalkanivorans TaxID=441112 RepID=A0A1I1PAZ9_9RHOB|nr:L,D-transpeptidase family protein [Tropicimonas isoalkanivorans]SFD06772.1 L,D-transpeptidase catalytic domain [Tropicimonas isoalkanivorans]